MYLLDTNICIFAIKHKSQELLHTISSKLKNGIFISSLTIAEMEFGISNSLYPDRNRMALLKFLSIFEILDFTQNDAIPYGQIKSDLKRSGNIIGPIDMLLAGQALSNNLVMVTNNMKEFERVENLKVEDWS
ncbi:type II toxin-antitoxin system VapC family toxin [Oceanispirochaeta sp.]|jgi:tRNA(fMet)-specific endonuclease VapC|uniref:type II toxin-antitoxin system tRNA(fMet)-specific endonuclease VapC n=1 Tax=Oceanispirochaeta sp. TaxID=2035350 RepID=UPI00261C92C1|nr:type II toxin-antitoxin system VapC family toxin [Oceanispirochaeta sp.]MDA3957485.1 type II toxin-antitoxin system VapC family toxin [Oceanispirochaeta sp.]